MRAATLESDASLRSTREAKLSTEFKASGSSYQCAWKPRLISAPFLPGPSPHFSAKTASSDGTRGSAEAAAPGGARWVRQASGEGARPRLPARDWSPSRGARPAPGGCSAEAEAARARLRVPASPWSPAGAPRGHLGGLRVRPPRSPGSPACAPREVACDPAVWAPGAAAPGPCALPRRRARRQATLQAARQPPAPRLPAAVTVQVQRPQQPSAPSPRGRMPLGGRSRWVGGGSAAGAPPAPGRGARRGSARSRLGSATSPWLAGSHRVHSTPRPAGASHGGRHTGRWAGTPACGRAWKGSPYPGAPAFCGWCWSWHAHPHRSIREDVRTAANGLGNVSTAWLRSKL